jgi:hypothetical protein
MGSITKGSGSEGSGEKKDYDPPRALRLEEVKSGGGYNGHCVSGTGPSEGCYGGNNATTDCNSGNVFAP